MSLAHELAQALHRFNAKERNHLMRFALLGETNPGPLTESGQGVHENFFEALRKTLASAPGDAAIQLSDEARCIYAAMDYHLDWLHAALWQVRGAKPEPDKMPCPVKQVTEPDGTHPQQDVMGNQEDADLIVVIEDAGRAILVLIEAKGDSSFSRSQLASKLARLKLILDVEDPPLPAELTCALVLLAPEDKLVLDKCNTYGDLTGHPSPLSEREAQSMTTPPEQLGPYIRRMPMPNFPDKLDLVTRCDELGRPPSSSPSPKKERLSFWRVAARRRKKGVAGEA